MLALQTEMEDARTLISVGKYRQRRDVTEISLFFSARRFVCDSHALCWPRAWQKPCQCLDNQSINQAFGTTMMDQPSANSKICRLCDAFLAEKSRDGIFTITSELDSIAKDLALDESLRYVALVRISGRSFMDRVQMGTGNPSIWPRLHQAWDALAEQVASFDGGDAPTRCLVTSYARFTRNLVAAVPSNQQNAL